MYTTYLKMLITDRTEFDAQANSYIRAAVGQLERDAKLNGYGGD